jgi:SAM-dependent methyltransferase
MRDLEEMRTGAWEYLLLGGACKVGIFDLLDAGKAGVEEVAAALGLEKRGTAIVLEALAAMGYLEKEGAAYLLPPSTRELLAGTETSPPSRYSLLHGMHTLEKWLQIPSILKGEILVGGEKEEGEATEIFIRAMGEKSRRRVREVVDLLLEACPGAKEAVDIGGGPGSYARELSRRGVSVTLFDRPEVIALVRRDLEGEGRIRFEVGDFNEKIPPGPFDIAYLGSIAHIYGERENRSLYRKVYEALRPGGVIGIGDFVRGRSPFAALFAVNMLVHTETGDTWSEAEFRAWLEAAGFRGIRVHDLSDDYQLIIGKKP